MSIPCPGKEAESKGNAAGYRPNHGDPACSLQARPVQVGVHSRSGGSFPPSAPDSFYLKDLNEPTDDRRYGLIVEMTGPIQNKVAAGGK